MDSAGQENPPRVYPVASADIELRIYNGSMRDLLQPHARCEIWTVTGVYLCTLTGAAITRMVQTYITGAALQTAVAVEMTHTATAEARRPLASAPARRQMPIPAEQRAALRAKRRARRKGATLTGWLVAGLLLAGCVDPVEADAHRFSRSLRTAGGLVIVTGSSAWGGVCLASS